MFRFGTQQKVSGKLDQMLQKPDLTVQQLFSIENIIGDIKQKVQPFVQYCKKHKQFTYRIIQLAMNTSLQDLQEKQLKDVAYVATQFISCDQDNLGQLFFGDQKSDKKSINQQQTIKNQSEISQKIEEAQPQNQSQTKEQQNKKSFDKIQHTQQIIFEQPNQQQKPIFQEFQLVTLSLQILKDPTKNQTCLGYISKLFGFLIRRQSDQPMKFFSTHPQYTNLLFTNIKYDSIANLLAQIVACQDRNRSYKYQEFKKQLFTRITDLMIEKISDQSIFDGIMIFIEQVLNNTKQSYYEYFQDFKRCANILVCQQFLSKVFNKMRESLESSEKQKQEENKIAFKNSVGYLHMIAKRINAENQDIDYYDQSDKKQPTMNFQTDFLYKNIDTIIKLIEKVNSQGLIAKDIFLSFIIELMKNQKFKDFQFDFVSDITVQLKCLKEWKHIGIIKNSLFQIIDLSILRADSKKITDLFQKYPQVIREHFSNLSEALPQLSTTEVQNEKVNLLRQNNKKQNVCYFYKTLFLLKSKDHENITKRLNDLGIKVDNMEIKYATSLASPSNSLRESNDFNLFSNSELQQINKSDNNSKDAQKNIQSISQNEKQKNQEKQKDGDIVPVSPVIFDLNESNPHSSFGQFVTKSHNVFIPTLNIPHHGSSLSGSCKENLHHVSIQNQKKLSEIIIDVDSQGVVIEEQQVQRVVINSPKRGGGLLGFMATTSSPRTLSFCGSFNSDRSSQGSNSARNKQLVQDQASKENTLTLNNNKKDQESKEKQNQKSEKPRIIRNVSQQEITFFVRHTLLI